MVLGKSEALAVAAGAPASPGRQGEPDGLQGVAEGVAGRVDRCGILEGRLRLGLDLRMTKLRRGAIVFGVVAGTTGQRQIAHPVAATPTPGQHMVQLEGPG